MEKRSTEISWALLWRVFKKRIFILLIIGVVCFAALFAYSYITYVPQYQSTAKLLILRKNEGNIVDDNGYVISDMMLTTCEEWITTRTVLEPTIEDLKDELNLGNMSWQTLAKKVSTKISTESRILHVTVTADSPEAAQKLVNSICKNTEETLELHSGEQHARFFEEGEKDKTPCNEPSILLMTAISAGVMLVALFIFVVLYITQDYIGSNADLEERLNVPILGDIPSLNDRRRPYGYNAYSVAKSNEKAEEGKK